MTYCGTEACGVVEGGVMPQLRLTGESTAAPLAVERELDHRGAAGGSSVVDICTPGGYLVGCHDYWAPPWPKGPHRTLHLGPHNLKKEPHVFL